MKKYLAVLLFILLLYSQNFPVKWLTEFEKSDSLSTPDYSASMDYFKQFADDFEEVNFVQFGVSPQGRKMFYLILDTDKEFNPNGKKPVIMIQNGIHAGEIEGKDACMLLLREILVEKKKTELVEGLTLIVIPIVNVDGHERKSKYNRINQNGPAEMGWRTTAQNYNLNRDYAKADSPEMKALLKLFSTWKPEIYIDSHTTDGLDYQYVLTYGIEKHQNVRNTISNWVKNEFINYFETELEKRGTLTSPYFSFLSENYFSTDPREGATDWVSIPRFSHGYAAYQNRIGLLLETHMLKPYSDRVVATKNAIELVLEMVSENPEKFVNLIKSADEEAIETFYNKRKSLSIGFESTDEFVEFNFKGYEPEKHKSEITGSEITTYTDIKFEEPIKYYNRKKVTDSVSVPSGYIIPKEWLNVIKILKLHGIQITEIDKPVKYFIERYHFTNEKFGENSYEGRQSVEADYSIEKDTVQTKIGDYFISTNQRLVPLIVHLLEPKAPDSFLRWGFFNSVFERKEYFEIYSMEPIAQKMLKENPELKKEFEQFLESNPEVKSEPYARLNFFYERSPYFDKNYKVYPILRVINEL